MKSALLVWGGWEGHEPEKEVQLFAPFLESQGYRTTISDTLDIYLDQAFMQAQDLIVPIWTMGTITGAQEQGLLSAVKSGAGLAGWHGCMADSFRQNVDSYATRNALGRSLNRLSARTTRRDSTSTC